MNFKIRLINEQYKLSDTENELADYIRREPGQVVDMTILDFANRFYTVPNTIIRLCKKLGYSGYSELKIDLKQEILSSSNQISERKVINDTFDLIDKKREKMVINKINKAEKVLLFAVGETSYPVQDFASTMNAFNHKTSFYTYENQIISDIQNSSRSIVILVSISGRTEQVLRIAEIAKSNSQYLISLTNIDENPLEKLSDLSLYCYAPSRIVRDIRITDKTPIYIILNSLRNAYINTVV